MKKLSLLFLTLAIPFIADAFSFSAAAPTGQTLYYTIVSGGVKVTYPYRKNANNPGGWNNYAQPSGKLAIPDSVLYNGKYYIVVGVDEYAFRNCGEITSCIIPNSCKNVGKQSFFNNIKLSAIVFGNTVNSIGDSAFYNCMSLRTVTIPDNVTALGVSCFSSCDSLKAVYLPKSLRTINSYCFWKCYRLKNIKIPTTVTKIGEKAFLNCYGLASLDIPSSVKTIGDKAFFNIPNINYYGTASGTPWGAKCVNAYYSDSIYYKTSDKTHIVSIDRSIINIHLPNSIQTIGQFAFASCDNIKTLKLPDNVQEISAYAFVYCENMQKIILPSSLKSIGAEVFIACTSMQSIVSKASTPPTLYSLAFDKLSNDITIIVPCEAVSTYKSTNGWNKFHNITCEGGGDNPNPDPGDSTRIANIIPTNITVSSQREGVLIGNANGENIDIFDVYGRTIYRKNIHGTELIPLQTGFYIVRINGILCRKTVVMK